MTKIENVTINEEQGLYVIPEAGGYSCLGFDVCLDRCWKYADWLRSRGFRVAAPSVRKRGSLEVYACYLKLLDKIRKVHTETGETCDVELTLSLIGLEGKRVEVVDRYCDKRRFQVGRSGGWIPVHLELHNRRSSGGTAVYGTPFRSVRVVPAARRKA